MGLEARFRRISPSNEIEKTRNVEPYVKLRKDGSHVVLMWSQTFDVIIDVATIDLADIAYYIVSRQNRELRYQT